MEARIQLRPRPILDPRGAPRSQPAALSPRPPALNGARLLLFDNGKLQSMFGPYHAIFEAITTELGDGVQFEEYSQDLTLIDKPTILGLARKLADRGYTAAVLALCDSGVTQPSILFAAELESCGVPTVAICLETTIDLATTAAKGFVPGLPTPAITALRSTTQAEVAAQTRRIMPAIVEGLTSAPEVLIRRFLERHGDQLSGLTARGGEILLDAEVTVAAVEGVALVDPNGFAEALYERFCEAVITDGFPVIAPTRDRVERMLAFTDRDPHEAIVEALPPSGNALTVEKLAISAVMAGCKPEYFPIVVTAMEGMADERYRLFQAVITSHPGANAVIVSGPLAGELGIAGGGGCLGPGYRANATIGRALSLCLLNVSRSLPGRSDLAVLGSPAEYSFCLAENAEHSPWAPLHVDLYDAETTTVTVHRCESPHQVLDHLSTTPERLLDTVASVAATLGGNNAYMPAELLVFLNPEHARIIASAGWSKRAVQQYLYERARNPVADLHGRGIALGHPTWMKSLDRLPVVTTPEEVMVIVAGGEGVASAVSPPWGYARAITRPVAFKDGRRVRSVREFAATNRSKEAV